MLRKCLIGALIAVLQAVALPGAAANAALWSRLRTPRSFKAGFIWQEGSGPPQRGELYFSHGRIRKQIQSPSGGHETIEIIRPDEKKIFQIDSGKHVFYVLPWNSRAALLSEALRRSEKRKLVGSEIIQGRDCDKYEGPRGPGALPYYFWVTKGSDLPVQLITNDTDSQMQLKIQLTDVTPGNQAPILFEPPIYFTQAQAPSSAGPSATSATGGSPPASH